MDLNHPTCTNCGKQLNVFLLCKESKDILLFCSKECRNEYILCDGGDDGYYSTDEE